MKVWLICGDKWHPEDVVVKGLGPLIKKHTVAVTTDGREAAAERFKDYDAVILAKSDTATKDLDEKWLTESLQKAFEDFVAKDGKGLLVLHSGATYGEGYPVMRGLAGGAFVNHPEQCLVTLGAVTEHPVTKGVSEFAGTDEHYFMQADEGVTHIMESRSTHGSCTAGWVKEAGAGRVCVLTPSHNAEIYLNENCQKLIENALNWCARA